MARREPEKAVPWLERALAFHYRVSEPEIELALADALWQIGKDRSRARALAEQARAGYEKLGHRPGTERSTRWLSDHP